MILDIALVIIILLSILIGYKKGFIRMLASFIGKFVALTIAYFYYASFKELLVKFTGLDKFVLEKIKLSLANLGGHAAEASVAGSDIDAVSKMPLPDVLKEKLVSYLTDSANQIGQSVASGLTDFLMNIIAFILLFILVAILISIIVKVLDLVAKLPVLNAFNKVGGILFSLITTYIMLTIAFLLITSFVSMDSASSLNSMIESSVVAKNLIVYNPILIGLANIHL